MARNRETTQTSISFFTEALHRNGTRREPSLMQFVTVVRHAEEGRNRGSEEAMRARPLAPCI